MSLDDITPPYEPISLLREALARAEGAEKPCLACVVVLIDADEHMWSDICGHEKMAVLWALERMKARLMWEEP